MKIFKLIKYSTVFFLLGMISCTNLNENVLDEQLGVNLVNDSSNIVALIQPPYASLRHTIEWYDYWALQEVSTDEVIVPTRGSDWYDNGAWIQLHLQTWTPDHIRMKNVWEALNQGYARANIAMYYIGRFPQDATTKLEISEARFLRAYYIYLINDLFGQVSFRDTTNLEFISDPQVLNRTEATNYIVSELENILPSLPTKKMVGSAKVTKGAARALLAKIYLNHEVYTGEAKWDSCKYYCDQLINDIDNDGYAIADDYWSMFQKDVAEHPEFILRVPMDDNVTMGSGSVWVNFTLHYSQTFGNITSTWNGPSTTSTFFDTWDQTNDVRFYDDRIKSETGFNQGFLIGQQYGRDGTPLEQRNGDPLVFVPEINLTSSPENAGIRVVKFAPNPNTQDQFSSPNDVPIMRMSDIYLIRAEAELRMGDEPSARADVNYLRSKRSAPGHTLPAYTSLTLEDILKERGYELYWEGLRRQDLIRFGKFTDAWQEKPATDATKELYPLPQSAVDVNENLTQNPGY